MSPTLYASALGAGVLSHVLYFNRYEVHLYSMHMLLTFIAWSVSLPAVLVSFFGLPKIPAIVFMLLLNTSFLTGAFGSTLIYRLFLNPLNKIPGPFMARISNFWWSSQLGKSDAYYKLDALHKKYGKNVRIGTNDVSTIETSAVEPSFSPQSKVTKAPWYQIDTPADSMHTTRDKGLHDRRRKVWAPAFSDRALRGYEELVQKYNDKLLARLDKEACKPINMTKWFNLYSFDVMGALAFGKQYGMLDTGVKTKELELLDEGMEPMAQMLPVWFIRLLITIPNLSPGYEKFVAYCRKELKWRVDNDPVRNGDKTAEKPQVGSDILTWILQAYREVRNPEKERYLQGDTRLIIVAGSDTTAATLTYMFYHLAQEPAVVKKIRAELLPLCQGSWSDKDIKNTDYLNGAINEALRLHPPVPSGLRRMVPKGGMMFGDVFMPGGTEFFFPQYVMGRDPANYIEPERFLPERWTLKPELIRQKDAFAPFSLGPMGCIGKNLALMELRTLTAQILLKFDVALAPGEDGHRILYETKDHFTLAVGDVDLVFTPIKV